MLSAEISTQQAKCLSVMAREESHTVPHNKANDYHNCL